MTIVAVAIQIPGTSGAFSAISPYRHADLATHLGRAGFKGALDERMGVRGFLTHQGAFLTRQEALGHVLKVGQPMLHTPQLTLGLFSEDFRCGHNVTTTGWDAAVSTRAVSPARPMSS